MACIYKINEKTFNTTEEIQNYVSSDEFVSVLAKGNSGISKEVRNLILNKYEKTNEVREIEDGQNETKNEGIKSKGKNDGQKTNDVQNEEVTEGGVKAPQVKTIKNQIADLRAAEQAEYDAMSNPKDKAKREEIYNRYDKLITPLLEQEQTQPALRDVESTAKALDGKDVEQLFEKTKNTKYYRGQPTEDLPSKDIFISPNEIMGKMYTKGKGVLKKLSLNTSNLFDIDNVVTKEFNDKLIDAWRKSVGTGILIPAEIKNGEHIGGNYSQTLKENPQFRRALEELGYDGLLNNFSHLKLSIPKQEIIVFDKSNVSEINANLISEAYHKAKADGSNPELVEAVESLLSKEQAPETKQIEADTKQQIAEFGVNPDMVEPVHSVIGRVFESLKKAGLTAAKNVGDWVGIGKGGIEKPYSLKINADKSKRKLKLYHSSTNIISGDFKMSGKNNSWGVFFSPKIKYSQGFGDMTYDVTVEPKNTLVLQDKEAMQNPFFNITKEQYDKYVKDGYDSIAWYRGGELTEFIALTNDIIKNKDLKYGEKISNRTYKIDPSKLEPIKPELKASVEGGQPLFKDAEAQYRIESGKNIVEAIKDFNGSPRATVALTHEIIHPTVVSIIDGAKEGNEVGVKHAKTIVSEFNKANPNSKVTVEDLIEGNDAFKGGTTSKQYRAVQEFIAKSWEKYHREGGKGFSESFQKVLDQITETFKVVYKSLSGKELTPELRKMFDEILGKESLLSKEQTTGENKYEYDPKAKDSSGDIVSRTDDSGTKKSDIAAVANKGQSDKNVDSAEEVAETSKPKPENVKAIEEAITKKSGTIKNEIIKEAANPTEVKKILDNLDAIKSKLAGFKTKDGDRIFSEECKWG